MLSKFKAYGFHRDYNKRGFDIFVRCWFLETEDHLKVLDCKILLMVPTVKENECSCKKVVRSEQEIAQMRKELQEDIDDQGIWMGDFVWDNDRV